jgi:signal transduction histidine kinase
MSDILVPTTPLPRGPRWKSVVVVSCVSSIIALVFALMDNGYSGLPQDLLIANAVGACIWLLFEVIQRVSQGRVGMVTIGLVAVPLGLIIGSKTAALFGAYDLVGAWTREPLNQWKSISVTVLFASCASAFVVLFMRAAGYRIELESERRRSAEAGRAQAIAELALLQAQIEPHFLFNTLAHVQSAIEEEPALGKAMLEHLIRYLRGTLRRSRASSYAVAEEVQLIESLLAIAAIRLGHRLRYRVDMPASVRTARLPPLLLQPLVENAIKHGIEAAIEGGEICVQVQQDGDSLVLRVLDTGMGIATAAPEGVGLANVRARLSSLYGERGRLALHRHQPRGTVAELRLPLQVGEEPV